jgi:hypothetical protein
MRNQTPYPDKDKFIGAVGERLSMEVIVTHRYTYIRPRYINPFSKQVVYIIVMVTPDRVRLVSKSPRFDANEGDRYRIKATVKCHERFAERAQTIVQRIAIEETIVKNPTVNKKRLTQSYRNAAAPWLRGYRAG